MKILTKDLTDMALDFAVSMCLDDYHYRAYTGRGKPEHAGPSVYRLCWFGSSRKSMGYSSLWEIAGPIIERELIEVTPRFHSAGYEHPKGQWYWLAFVLGPNNIDENFEQSGPTPLIAAMRCYVASKLGDTVEIPEELT